jgi:NADH-quinone oxidoreductase subunit K
MLVTLFVVAAILLLVAGFFSLIVSRNLIRVLIAMEILTKAATLMLIFAGHLTHQTGVAQEFVITLIIIEVVVMSIAAGIIIGIYQRTDSLDTNRLGNLKG